MKNSTIENHTLYNHITSKLSDLDMRMVINVPEGGNWKNIPESVPSKRLEQIRKSGGRTTYYGRLRWDEPSYTVTTYFNRPGNGCYMHPDDSLAKNPQHRLISLREAARLQSFPDKYRFSGPKTSIYKQIGNAVPPLLAYSIAKMFPAKTAIDLFCGAGGLSHGFEMAGFSVLAGIDNDKHSMETWKNNHKGFPICGDISNQSIKNELYQETKQRLNGKALDLIIGGPPCQGFSTAGWRDSVDPRNQLWNHYLDIVNNLKPKYFIIENVPGLLSSTQQGKTVMQIIKTEFKKIGYSINHQKLKAEEFGVPQKRRRVFIIGHYKGVEPVHFPEPINMPVITVRDTIEGLPVLKMNDGSDEIIINKYKPISAYDAWLSGSISLQEMLDFYGKKIAA